MHESLMFKVRAAHGITLKLSHPRVGHPSRVSASAHSFILPAAAKLSSVEEVSLTDRASLGAVAHTRYRVTRSKRHRQLLLAHSERSATIGSTFVARRAGR